MSRLLSILFLALAGSASAQLARLLVPVGKAGSAAPALAGSDVVVARTIETKDVLGADAVVAELEKQLGARFAVEGDFKLQLVQAWQPLKLPSEDWQLSIVEFPNSGLESTFYVKVVIRADGGVLVEGQLPLRAQLWQDVWIAASRIERGQALDRGLLAAQKVDVLRSPQPLIPATLDPASCEAVQTIPAGRALTKRDVIPRPIVRKGQVVEVTAVQGMLVVRMKALALESGAAGDLIKLRNLESRREISGQILNESQVHVHF